jgi:uncharacterized membrane protein
MANLLRLCGVSALLALFFLLSALGMTQLPVTGAEAKAQTLLSPAYNVTRASFDVWGNANPQEGAVLHRLTVGLWQYVSGIPSPFAARVLSLYVALLALAWLYRVGRNLHGHGLGVANVLAGMACLWLWGNAPAMGDDRAFNVLVWAFVAYAVLCWQGASARYWQLGGLLALALALLPYVTPIGWLLGAGLAGIAWRMASPARREDALAWAGLAAILAFPSLTANFALAPTTTVSTSWAVSAFVLLVVAVGWLLAHRLNDATKRRALAWLALLALGSAFLRVGAPSVAHSALGYLGMVAICATPRDAVGVYYTDETQDMLAYYLRGVQAQTTFAHLSAPVAVDVSSAPPFVWLNYVGGVPSASALATLEASMGETYARCAVQVAGNGRVQMTLYHRQDLPCNTLVEYTANPRNVCDQRYADYRE